ncbi:MAG TPA: hypothetical protein VNU68_17525 [Verrucomicrobiae bacterium]|nr:hypothetical protein [Verrucomicrobiae bacterium]
MPALLLGALGAAHADSLVAWGDNGNSQISPLPSDTDLITISAGGGHSAAIKANHTVVVWGLNVFGQHDIPPGLANVVGVAAGYDHTVALRSDGTVVSWGRNQLGQTNVPPGLANVVAVSANGYHSLALLANGTLVPWGDNSSGQGNIPAGLTDVIAISSGPNHQLALRRDGSVVGWGRNDFGQSDTPPGLSGVVQIVAGGEHNLARKANGTVVAWGHNNFGQTNVADGLSDVIGIAAGWAHSMVLRAGGTVVARGWNDFGQATVPAGLSGVTAISGGYQHSVALVGTGDPRPVIHCPADVQLTCTDCNTDPANTGRATAEDNGTVRVSYTDAVSGDCPKTVLRTWTATDDADQTATCLQTIICRADHTLTISCPADVIRPCTDCNLDPSQTGTATATGSGQVQISYIDSSSGDCPKVVKRTWTATDQAAQTASCVQTLTCRAQDTNTTLTITCPADVIRTCANCNLDPSQTGTATATGSSPIQIAYTDSSQGDCPKMVQRTWTATDAAGQTASCVQTLTCLPANMITDGSGCAFDLDPSTPQQDFRLSFSLDPHNPSCFRLGGSNPSGFFYAVLQTGTPGQSLTLNLNLPYPFVTTGATPFRAYDWVKVTINDVQSAGAGEQDHKGQDGDDEEDDHTDHPDSGSGSLLCLQVGQGILASADNVTLADYGSPPSAFTTASVTVTVPASGVVFLAVRLDYGLENTTGYSKNSVNDAVDCGTGQNVLIPNHGQYGFSVSGDQTADITIGNINAFAQAPGVYGYVRNASSGAPVPGTVVTFKSPRGAVIAKRTTGADGFYYIQYKHKGKEATYSVSILTPSGYQALKKVPLKANRTVEVDFNTP